LTESCILAAGTILSSLDRTVDPCDDFYKFSCGGWQQRSTNINTDRFQAIDKRNQNILHSILQQESQANVSVAEEKAKLFYSSCVVDRQGVMAEDLNNLQMVIEFAGGWNISGEYNKTVPLSERLYRLQNQLGVSALFTWGVVPENNSNHLAIVPGGWVEDYLQDVESYSKLMLGISFMLQESAKCPPVEYVYDMELDLTDGETINETIEVDYEYSYDINTSQLPNLFSVFKKVFWPSSSKEFYFHPGTNFSMEGVDGGFPPDHPVWDYSPQDFEGSGDYYDEGGDRYRRHNPDFRSARATRSATDYEPEQEKGRDPEKHIHRTSREDCINGISKDVDESMLGQRLDLELEIKSILYIEERLRNLTNSAPGHSDVKLTSMTMAELEKQFNFLGWSSFFKRSFEMVEHELEADTPILVDLPYLQGLSSLLEELEPAQLNNYLIWRLVVSFYPSKYSEEHRRKETCLKQTEDVFGPVITAIYVRHKTVEWSRQVVEEVDMMVDTMKDAFSVNMDKMDWMSNKSRRAAKEKLSGMMDLIGYPEQVLNSTWLNQRYEEVEVTSDYLMNIIAFQSHERKEGMKLYINKYERGSWSETSHGGSIVTVNAFYSPNTNTMIVPIGMLQDPLYWSKPKSLTFGAFGIVVAHEITHAFDDEGINYNHEGVMDPLYDNSTIDAFHNEADCLREQYSSYQISDVSVDGNLTLTENLADHGGLKMAYSAYNSWRKHNQDSRLPALNFTDLQLFFLGYALPWCSSNSDVYVQSHLLKDEHSPSRFRVLGPLSNSKSFAEAWNCPLGSNMNPVDKCSVW